MYHTDSFHLVLIIYLTQDATGRVHTVRLPPKANMPNEQVLKHAGPS